MTTKFSVASNNRGSFLTQATGPQRFPREVSYGLRMVEQLPFEYFAALCALSTCRIVFPYSLLMVWATRYALSCDK